MAITPSDFSKIWASNADTPEYTFNEADYLKGWDFVGNLPPTRAQWNAIQKRTDEKMKYVFDNFGAPLTASTVADMTMQNRVYVYTGNETGYTAGHWYYWNGSAWTDGGVYNSNTVQVDPTLTISGAAADAKATGDRLSATESITENIVGQNKIDPSTIVDNSRWDGGTPTSGSYSRTDYVKVKPNTAYTFANTDYNYWSLSAVQARFVDFFDADKVYLSKITYATSFTTPQDCEYVGITFRLDARNVILLEGTYDASTQTMVYVPYIGFDLLNNKVHIDGSKVDNLTVENITNYANAGKNLFDKTKALQGKILGTEPRIIDNAISFVSDYIPVKTGVSYVISNQPQTYSTSSDYSIRSYVLFDEQYQKVSGENGDVKTKVVTPTVDGFLRFTGYMSQLNWVQVEVGSTPTAFEPYQDVLPTKSLLNDEQMKQVNNVLYKKKWAVCGDSFSNGVSASALFDSGKFIGLPKVYPYFIAERNDMDVARFFDGGRTLAYPSDGTFHNSLTDPTASFYYQNIPADVDYITIYLGINDSSHNTGSSPDGEQTTGYIGLGTIDDNTTETYYGAWNVVMSWLIVNRPFAHIGIIVSNGVKNNDWRMAQINIAKKYGVQYMDLNGDQFSPAMLRTVNPDIPSFVKQALIQKQAVDPDGSITGTVNLHPNDQAHEYESYNIEAFLRRL